MVKHLAVLILVFSTWSTSANAKPRVSAVAVQDAISMASTFVYSAVLDPVTQTVIRAPARELGVTVSGGVSLGVYQAGFMYVLTEVMKLDHSKLRLFTGASAGSANALIGAINSCLPSNPDPREDLGWQVWMDVGYDALFDPARVSSVSVFNRDALILATDKVGERLKDGLRSDCDVVIGMATTRAEARIVDLAPGLSVPSQDEKFVVRIRGMGLGKAPIIENYVDPRSNVEQPLLPFRELRTDDDFETAKRNFDHVVDVVFASMSFPIAFAPKQLQFCYTTRSPPNEALVERPKCETPQRREPFLDGGVYDNNPLRLAHSIARQGLKVNETGEVFWRDPVSPPELFPPYNDLRFLYVDPDTQAYPTVAADVIKEEGDDELISQAVGLVTDFVETSRSRELYELLRSNAELDGRMRLSKVHYPTVSEHLYAFMGFLEKDFRIFDFYLGMYDGLVTARAYTLDDAYGSLDMDPVLRPGGEFAESWKPFACMLGWFEAGHANYREACAGPELRNFRILLQVSLDRIYSQCSLLTPSEMGTFHHEHCEAATRRRSPPQIPGVRAAGDSWNRLDDESTFEFTLRLLTYYQFQYKDLGLSAADAGKGKYRIRRSILALVKAIANAQTSATERTALLTFGRSAVNDIAYESPGFYGYIVVGSAAEGGVSWTPFDWDPNWLRLNMSLQMKGLFAALTLDGTGLQMTPMMGPEFEIGPLTNALFQPIIGLRGGFQFSTVDNFTFRKCSESAAGGDERRCSQIIAQPYIAFTFLERVRLQLVTEVFVKSFNFDDRRYNLLLGIGGHFF